MPKARMPTYLLTVYTVHLNEPPNYGNVAITEKSGGCKGEANDRERTSIYKPVVRLGTWVGEKKRVMLFFLSHQFVNLYWKG
jgi:hypothetical protein